MIFRSKKGREVPAATATVEDVEPVFEEIRVLADRYRESRDPELARRILRLRHRAGMHLINHPDGVPGYPDPSSVHLPAGGPLIEVEPGEVTPELLRAAILEGGCLLIRGLVPEDDVQRLTDGIDRAIDTREAQADSPYFEEFEPDPRFDFNLERSFLTNGGGGAWAADSPPVIFDVLDVFERSGIRQLAAEYLGERPTISVNKSVLRKVTPSVFEKPTEIHGSKPSVWHQDGAFLRNVRALNVWLSLSRCGDVAPGLDIVPRRVDHIVPTGTEGAIFEWTVSQAMAEQTAGDAGIVRPVFQPGDALLFDELFLHCTAAEADMPGTRYAVESWFFGGSGFPERYAPLAV